MYQFIKEIQDFDSEQFQDREDFNNTVNLQQQLFGHCRWKENLKMMPSSESCRTHQKRNTHKERATGSPMTKTAGKINVLLSATKECNFVFAWVVVVVVVGVFFFFFFIQQSSN